MSLSQENITFPSLAPEAGKQRAAASAWYLDFVAWTVALAVIGYPLAGLISSYLAVSDSSISIAFHLFVVFLSAAVFVVNGVRFGLRPLDTSFVIFYLWYLGRLIWDTGRADQPDADLALLIMVGTTIIPLIGVLVPRVEWDERNLAKCMFAVGAAISVLSIVLYRLGLSVDDAESLGRLEFEKLNPITLGHTAATTILTAVIGWQYWKSHFWRLASLVPVACAASILFLAASRGPLIAFGICFSFYSIAKKQWILLAIMVGSLLVVVNSAPIFDGETLFERIRISGIQPEDSASLRITFMTTAWEEFLDNPLFGSGYSLPVVGGYPHNVIVEAAMALGIGGLVLLLSLFGRAMFKAWPAIRGEHALSAILFVQYFVATEVSGSLWGDAPVVIFMVRLLSPVERAPR